MLQCFEILEPGDLTAVQLRLVGVGLVTDELGVGLRLLLPGRHLEPCCCNRVDLHLPAGLLGEGLIELRALFKRLTPMVQLPRLDIEGLQIKEGVGGHEVGGLSLWSVARSSCSML